MEVKLCSLCQVADDQLTTFMDSLNLECLEIYKDNSCEISNDGYEKSNVAELPQVSICLMFILVDNCC